jgi:hypothetical protein
LLTPGQDPDQEGDDNRDEEKRGVDQHGRTADLQHAPCPQRRMARLVLGMDA